MTTAEQHLIVIFRFRELREQWFLAHVRSNAHERDGETEEDEERRQQWNQRLKAKYDEQTTAIIAGGDYPTAPRCAADMDRKRQAETTP